MGRGSGGCMGREGGERIWALRACRSYGQNVIVLSKITTKNIGKGKGSLARFFPLILVRLRSNYEPP